MKGINEGPLPQFIALALSFTTQDSESSSPKLCDTTSVQHQASPCVSSPSPSPKLPSSPSCVLKLGPIQTSRRVSVVQRAARSCGTEMSITKTACTISATNAGLQEVRFAHPTMPFPALRFDGIGADKLQTRISHYCVSLGYGDPFFASPSRSSCLLVPFTYAWTR